MVKLTFLEDLRDSRREALSKRSRSVLASMAEGGSDEGPVANQLIERAKAAVCRAAENGDSSVDILKFGDVDCRPHPSTDGKEWSVPNPRQFKNYVWKVWNWAFGKNLTVKVVEHHDPNPTSGHVYQIIASWVSLPVGSW